MPLFGVVDCGLQVLPDEGEEGLESAGFGVGVAGVAEEYLVCAAGCCVVGAVVLEEEAGGCGVCCCEGRVASVLGMSWASSLWLMVRMSQHIERGKLHGDKE